MDQRVSLITLGVSDLARSRAFYEALSWRSNTDPDLGVVFFQTGGFVFALWSRDSPAEADAVIEEARRAGARIAREPGETFWGGYSGVFVDPDGHPWEVAHNPRWTVTDDGRTVLP